MPSIGPACHEVRFTDENSIWRVIYHIGPTAIVVLDIFQKKTNRTPEGVIEDCRRRPRKFQADRREKT